MSTTAVTAMDNRTSLVVKMANKYGVEPGKLLSTLKATAFRSRDNQEISNEQMMALLIVADAHNLNPWLKQIYAFPDKNNGIVPVVGIDGFLKIANEHPQFNGMEFRYDDSGEWVECTIHRKDRAVATTIREYLNECARNTPAWGQWPRRMLRHRSIAQCVRVAFNFGGVMEQDEAEAYIEGQATEVKSESRAKPRTAPPRAIQQQPEQQAAPTVIEAEKEPVPVLSQTDARVALLKLSDTTGVPLKEIEQRLGKPVDEADAESLNAAIAWVREITASA